MHTYNTDNCPGEISFRCNIQEQFNAVSGTRKTAHFEVGGLLALQRLLQHLCQRSPKFFNDHADLQTGPDNLLLRVPRELCRLFVPLIYEPVKTDAKNRRVGCIDESLQLRGNARLFHLHFLSLRNVLSNRNHSDRLPRCIAIRRAVEKEVNGFVAFGVELNFNVLRRSAIKSFLDEALHHIA